MHYETFHCSLKVTGTSTIHKVIHYHTMKIELENPFATLDLFFKILIDFEAQNNNVEIGFEFLEKERELSK